MKKIDELITFKENEKKDYDKYSQIRGEQLYFFICKFLVKENAKVDYCYVRDLIRYDKRLKDKLYIYLGTFEDCLKTLLYEKTNYFWGKFQLSETIDHSSFKEININTKKNYDLKRLIEILKKIYPEEKQKSSEFTKIKNFRNKVMHHNFLLLEYAKENEIQTRIPWLKENILMLKKYLPREYQSNFIKDINNCKKDLCLKEDYEMEDL